MDPRNFKLHSAKELTPHGLCPGKRKLAPQDAQAPGALWGAQAEGNLPAGPADFLTLALRFQQLIVLYESTVKSVLTQLEIFQEDFRVKGAHVPIQSCSSRIKEPLSIVRKLRKQGVELSLENIQNSLNDIAGVRVICPYLEDLYAVRDLLVSWRDFTLVEEKDYVRSPKPSGYRSLHLIADVTVHLSSGVQKARCEIQLRTIAMDSWATLEHQLRYKSKGMVSAEVANDLVKCSEMLFASDLKMQQIAETGLKIYFTGCVFAGLNIVHSVFFTSTERPLPAHVISLLRGFILIIPLAFLLSSLAELYGVWAAFPVTELLVCAVGGVLLSRYR